MDVGCQSMTENLDDAWDWEQNSMLHAFLDAIVVEDSPYYDSQDDPAPEMSSGSVTGTFEDNSAQVRVTNDRPCPWKLIEELALPFSTGNKIILSA